MYLIVGKSGVQRAILAGGNPEIASWTRGSKTLGVEGVLQGSSKASQGSSIQGPFISISPTEHTTILPYRHTAILPYNHQRPLTPNSSQSHQDEQFCVLIKGIAPSYMLLCSLLFLFPPAVILLDHLRQRYVSPSHTSLPLSPSPVLQFSR